MRPQLCVTCRRTVAALDSGGQGAQARGRRGEDPGAAGPGLAVGLREDTSVFCKPAAKPGTGAGWGKGGGFGGRDAGLGASLTPR
jgi:hypothetical protein